jgi:hypothetical protein
VNLDLSSTFNFGDDRGLRTFLLDHRFVHEQTSNALALKLGGSYSTVALDSALSEEAWVELMRRRQGPVPQALQDWLELHAQIHNQTYELLSGQGTVAPDLSVVDFGKPLEFYDWMYVHSQMHDFEQSSLGLT